MKVLLLIWKVKVLEETSGWISCCVDVSDESNESRRTAYLVTDIMSATLPASVKSSSVSSVIFSRFSFRGELPDRFIGARAGLSSRCAAVVGFVEGAVLAFVGGAVVDFLTVGLAMVVLETIGDVLAAALLGAIVLRLSLVLGPTGFSTCGTLVLE